MTDVITEYLEGCNKMKKVSLPTKGEPATREELLQIIRELLPLALAGVVNFEDTKAGKSLPHVAAFHQQILNRAARAIGIPTGQTGPVVPESQKVGHDKSLTPANTACSDCAGEANCSLFEQRKVHETCTLFPRCNEGVNA